MFRLNAFVFGLKLGMSSVWIEGLGVWIEGLDVWIECLCVLVET